MTNWPTPQVVIMQTGVQLQKAFAPYPLTTGSAPGLRWELYSPNLTSL